MANKNTAVEDSDEQRPGGTPKAATSRGNLWVILVGLLVMIATPTASYFAVRASIAPSARTPKQEAAGSRVVMTIDPLIVNIAGTRMTRVLRIQVHLVLSEARLEEPLRDMMPMVKDRIMTTTGLRTLDDLEGMDGRDALKRDIIAELNSMIRDRMAGRILDVAFSEFLIQ